MRSPASADRKTRAELVLLGTTLFWSSTFALVKIAMQEVTSLQMVVLRFGAAGLCLLALAGRRIFPIPRAAVVKGYILGLMLFGGFVVQNEGLKYTTASKSAFITGLMVLLVPILQFMIERRAPKL